MKRPMLCDINDALQQRKKLYSTYRWKKVRAAHLREHPWCAACRKQNKLVHANTVDHTEGHSGDWKSRFWVGPFTSLCASCHSRKTVAETTLNKAVRFPWRHA